MKKVLTTALLVASCIWANAQGGAAIQVVIPSDISEKYGDNVSEQIRSRVTQLLTSADGADGAALGIVAKPILSIEDKHEVENDYGHQTIVKANITVVLKHELTNKTVHSFSMSNRGTGNSENNAISKALGGIKASDPKAKAFAASLPAKMEEFYKKNCESIIAEGNKQMGSQKPHKALAFYGSIPKSAPCFDEANEKFNSMYPKLMELECASELIGIKTAIANNDLKKVGEIVLHYKNAGQNQVCYEKALEMISNIDTEKITELQKLGILARMKNNDVKSERDHVHKNNITQIVNSAQATNE